MSFSRFLPAFFLLLLSMGHSSTTLAQFGQVPDGPDYEIIHLAGDVYRYRNLRHFSVFMLTPEGVIMGDPINSAGAEWLKKELKERFDTEVKYVVSSHYHQDHAAGGDVFADTATFVGHENMPGYFQPPPEGMSLAPAQRRSDANANGTLEADEAPGFISRVFDQLDLDKNGSLTGTEIAPALTIGVRPPDIVFSEQMTIELGGKKVELIYPGPNHTDDMVVMYFPEEKVVHTVDYITAGRLPRSMSAWSEQVPAAIAAVEALDFKIFSGGHEGIGTKGDVIKHREYVEDLIAGVKAGIERGETAQQILQSINLEQHRHLGLFEEYLPNNVANVYDALMAK